MAVTSVYSTNQAITFRKKAILSYVRENLFGPYMGADTNNIIVKLMELEGARTGDQLNIPIVADLIGQGVGAQTLVGNEESIDNYGQRVWIDWARNGVALTKNEKKKLSFDLWSQKAELMTRWGKALLRDEMVLTMNSIPSETVPTGQGGKPGVRVNGLVMSQVPTNQRSRWVPPSTSLANTAQLNLWHVNNSDRIIYGQVDTNYVAGNHAASLATLSVASSQMSTAIGTRARDRARNPIPLVTTQTPGSPVIPKMTDDSREWFVCFLGQGGYRSLKADPVMINANRDARAREGGAMKDNPLFQSGDMIYDGVIYREIPEITMLTARAGAGSGGATVEPFFLCGQAALGVAWGEEPEITERAETDYGFVDGVGFEAAYGLTKVARRSANWGTDAGGNPLFKDFGMVTGFVATN